MIKYRDAKIDDFNQVVEIENSCFKEPYKVDDLMYEFTKNPVNKIIVAVSDNKIVGFIDFLITFNSSTIMQIAVREEYRRKGIATRLLEEMEKTFPTEIDDLVENITLEVRESNTAAQELYKSVGYQTITVKKQYYKDGENAVYMLKRL